MKTEVIAKKKCALLMSSHRHLADSAEDYCSRLFEIVFVTRRSRKDNQLPKELSEIADAGKIDYLFNFLSPIIVPSGVLGKVKIDSINFHPAPPEWPGVGSSSYALYEGCESYGVTAHKMLHKVDSGEIYDVARFPVLTEDDCESLFRRSIEYSLIQFYRVIEKVGREGVLKPTGEKWVRPGHQDGRIREMDDPHGGYDP